MNTPFHLRKASEPVAVAGLLLVSDRAADLLALVAALGAGRPPTAFAVPGGFLLKLATPTTAIFPNTIRLRTLAADLFLPADAELIPALLPDEAAGLVGERGLVFLPGGRVLGYAVGRPLQPAALLEVERRPDRTWRALPERPARAERLREILLDLPNDTTDAVLQPGGEGVGVEEPRPPAVGPLATAGGAVQLGAGKALMWLGNLFRMKGVARLGAQLAQSAVEWAPRLSESVLGRQEAALRELLRQFREGDLERALRRALPLGEEGGRGGKAARDARLPVHNLFYSLNDLLGRKPGRASVWLGGGGVQRDLAVEYRKAAEAATARGDYRRAAFIYGKLLREFYLAGSVLSRGGLHHDAAILYLEKLDDARLAARAFAAAGEVDRAVQLYRQRGEHALAGDLLRQAGDDEAALAEFRIAADRLAAGHQHHAAGELMLTRACRPDAARGYFTAGWARRPWVGSFPCLQSLARLAAEEDAPENLLALVDEADAFFAKPGSDAYAAPFYNELARLADRGNLAPTRDDLRDRALRGLAVKLRQSVSAAPRPGPEPSLLLGQSGEWPAAVVSDAAFAFRAAIGPPRPPAPAPGPPPAVSRVRLGRGQVTAACAAPRSGRLCVGFASGLAFTFDPRNGSVLSFTFGAKEPWATTAVAFDAEGEQLVILRTKDGKWGHVAGYLSVDGAYRRPTEAWWSVPASSTAALAAPVAAGGGTMAGLWDGRSLVILSGPDLIPVGRVEAPFPPDAFRCAVLFGEPGKSAPPICLLFDEETAWQTWPTLERTNRTPLPLRFRHGWRPGAPESAALRHPILSWQRPSLFLLELVEVDEGGALHWSGLEFSPTPWRADILAFSGEEKYRAAAFVGADRLAGVRRGGVDWLRRTGNRLTKTATTRADLGDAVACFFSPPTRELLVITAEGDVVRAPAPNA